MNFSNKNHELKKINRNIVSNTNYFSIIIILFFSWGLQSQTGFKKDSIHLFQWDNNIDDWHHNTREYLTYDNGGNKETNLLRQILSGSNWANFYQFNKTYTTSNILEENIRQNWNGSSWDNSAKYDYLYDSNDNETNYLYSFFTSGNWQGYQQEIKSYVGNNLDIKTNEQYDFTFMEFIPEEQFLYTYAGSLLDYEIERMYFPDVAAWENVKLIDYTYNAGNQLTDIEHFGFNSTTGEFSTIASPKTSHTYTSEGLIEERVTQIWATSQYMNTERFAYTYLDGNQTELLLQNWSTTTNNWVNSYRHLKTFDTDNNEIEFIYENWDTTTNTWKGFLRIVSFWSEEETLAIEKSIENTLVTVFPNPAANHININSSHSINAIKLYNLLGKKVLQTTQKEQVDISNLQAGIYLIKIDGENGTITKKLVIK